MTEFPRIVISRVAMAKNLNIKNVRKNFLCSFTCSRKQDIFSRLSSVFVQINIYFLSTKPFLSAKTYVMNIPIPKNMNPFQNPSPSIPLTFILF